MWWRLGLVLVLSFLQNAFYKPPPGPKAAALKDFNIPKSNDGDPIYDGGGTFWVKDSHVAWSGDLRTRGIYKKGGKK